MAIVAPIPSATPQPLVSSADCVSAETDLPAEGIAPSPSVGAASLPLVCRPAQTLAESRDRGESWLPVPPAPWHTRPWLVCWGCGRSWLERAVDCAADVRNPTACGRFLRWPKCKCAAQSARSNSAGGECRRIERGDRRTDCAPDDRVVWKPHIEPALIVASRFHSYQPPDFDRELAPERRRAPPIRRPLRPTPLPPQSSSRRRTNNDRAAAGLEGRWAECSPAGNPGLRTAADQAAGRVPTRPRPR